MKISKNTMAILKQAGWYEGRKIDVTETKLHCESMGYEVFPAVVKFLEEFGDLKIVIPKPNNLGEKEERHSTFTKRIIGNYFTHSGCIELEKYANEGLVVVGQACRENLLVYVSESGKVYCDTGWLGDTAIEAFESLISEKGFRSWSALGK